MAGRGEPEMRILEEPPPCLDSSQGCPSRPSAPVSRCETCHHQSSGAALWITFWTKRAAA